MERGRQEALRAHRGGPHRRRGRPRGPLEDASRRLDWEALTDVRQAGFGLMEAFGQVWKTGSKEQREKALAVVNDARKKLYLILADED